MAETYGVCRSVTVYDVPDANGYRGEAEFSTKAGLLVLKLSNDSDTSFLAMVTVLSGAIQYGNKTPDENPNVHIKYTTDKKELDRVTFHWHLYLHI